MIKILAFSGSGRKDSYNTKVVNIAAQGATEAGAKVTIVDLAEFDMPIFNEDLESKEGMHSGGQKFKRLLIEHDGFLISSPEHNSSYSALLKNSIDWASRQVEGETPMQAYKGKVAGIMGASPGALGGLRGLVSLRMLLENIGVMVLPGQKAVSKVHTLLDDNGHLADEKTQNALKKIGKELVNTLSKLKA
jgi:chromate reductase